MIGIDEETHLTDVGGIDFIDINRSKNKNKNQSTATRLTKFDQFTGLSIESLLFKSLSIGLNFYFLIDKC